MLWIKEVEMVKSLDDLVTSQSIEGRGFPDFGMLDAQKASALKRTLSNQFFRRRDNVEEQTAQKKKRQISTRKVNYFCDL